MAAVAFDPVAAAPELGAAFRRCIASRLFPDDVLTQLGINHAPGLLIYGKPAGYLQEAALAVTKFSSIAHSVLGADAKDAESRIADMVKTCEAELTASGEKSPVHILLLPNLEAHNPALAEFIENLPNLPRNFVLLATTTDLARLPPVWLKTVFPVKIDFSIL